MVLLFCFQLNHVTCLVWHRTRYPKVEGSEVEAEGRPLAFQGSLLHRLLHHTHTRPHMTLDAKAHLIRIQHPALVQHYLHLVEAVFRLLSVPRHFQPESGQGGLAHCPQMVIITQFQSMHSKLKYKILLH